MAAFSVALTEVTDVTLVEGLVDRVGAKIGERLLDGIATDFADQAARDSAVDFGKQALDDGAHAPVGDVGGDMGTTAADEGANATRAAGCGTGLSFSADTPVATPSGERAIGSLKVGDQVTAYDPATGHAEPQTVQHVWINHDHDLVDVTVRTGAASSAADDTARAQRAAVRAHGSQAPPPADETIHTTANHPWLTADRGWVSAADLKPGEAVVTLGSTATVAAVRVVSGQADYYNLTVATDHTYAVGAVQAVVHNTKGCVSPADQVRAKVAEIKGAMYEGEVGRTTYGVAHVTTADGADELWVSQAGMEGYVRPGLRGDAINVRAPSDLDLPHINDAEMHLWRAAEAQGATINAIGATRPVCMWCQTRLPDSIPIVTELKS